jgi:hypothetical protein
MRRLIVAMSQKEGVVADTMVEVVVGGGGCGFRSDERWAMGDGRCTVRAHDRRHVVIVASVHVDP